MQFKDENRRFTGGKSRFEDAEVQEKMPKMLPGEFRNTRYKQGRGAERILALLLILIRF